MTIVRTQLFNGPVGTALDTTNTDYTTFFGTSRFTNTYTREGTAAAEFYSGATATATYARYTLPGETNTYYFSRYLQHNALPSAITTFYRFRRSATTQCLLRMTSAGLWLIADSGSVAQATMTKPIVANQPYRLEIDLVNQVITMRLYLGANIEGTVADDTITATLVFPSGAGSGNIADYDEGYITARANYSLIIDAIRDGNTSNPGPYTVAPPTITWPRVRGVISGGTEIGAHVRGVIVSGSEVPAHVKTTAVNITPPPAGVLWEGTGLKGQIPPWTTTDLTGGTSDPNNEWSAVEMDGNTVALNNAPDLSFDSTLRYNSRPGKSVKIVMHGTNTTGTAEGTKRAQFRVNMPYWQPTADGNDNEVWFGYAFYLGAGYVISDLTASQYHNIWGFRHFTSNDSTFYVTVESEDGGLVMRRATTSTWADGLGSDQLMIGAVNLGWNTLVVHAKLSTTPTNALREAWVNGVYGGAQTTANITGTSDIRMRMGPYNWDGYTQNRTFAFANARVGTSYAAVDPEALS